MTIDFDAYFKALATTPVDQKTEHTDRGALERLLNEAAGNADARLRIQHEPKRDQGGGGSPDYMVKRDARIVGYVEVKTVDEALSKILRSDQIRKYQKLSDNLLLTDYLEFIWLRKGEDPQRARLAHSEDLSARRLALKSESVDQVAGLLRGFFSTAPQNIGKGQTLAVELATRAAILRDLLHEELVRQQKDEDLGKLHGLYAAFRDQIFHDLTIKDFADAFGQMLAYGLFLARLNAGEGVEVRLDNVRRFIPGSFSLIRELVRFLEELEEDEYRHLSWVVDEILSIVNGINLAAIKNDLSFRARKAISRKIRAGDEEEHRLFEKDPFIYFYEDFLKAYDPAMRKGRGVYYTPPPVVNFIVRAIDDILKDTFQIRDGLADHKRVTVLDFATGTGTFLLEVFERIFDTIGGPEAGRADAIVREHLTKNIYGFEYLIAPYTIAHLKLSQYLRDKGHPLRDEERLQVFLTNTLEPVEPQGNLLMPAIAAEVEGAQSVKDQPILVITGNPPYAGNSKNPSSRIVHEEISTRMVRGRPVALTAPKKVKRKVLTNAGSLVAPYFVVDGRPLGERNSKWLNDDYVKFIAFAQSKMADSEEGVVGIITNHSWLDNPTFRGMRQSLKSTFDQIFILDLHGSTKPKEPVPPGEINDNVFDITKGVAVAIFIKKPGLESSVKYAEIWGDRLTKYRRSAEATIKSLEWENVDFFSPYYMARPMKWDGWSDYAAGWSIADSLAPSGEKRQIFGTNVLGFQTHRDHFAIAFGAEAMNARVQAMLDATLSDERLKERFDIEDNRDWKLKDARAQIRELEDPYSSVISCAYRPFDNRPAFFGEQFMDYPRRELMDHVFGRSNIQLLVPRQIGGEHWRHAFAASSPPNDCVISDQSSEANYVFPVWLFSGDLRTENLSTEFRDFIDARYDWHHDPEEILGYIYAVLHAPTYRSRYAEFLRIDFPRIPFAETRQTFEGLSKLGWDLIQAHLLKVVPRSSPRLGDYVDLRPRGEKGDHTVEAVTYSPEEATVWINPKRTLGFANVPQAVWEFHIGGYQVLDKYLKSRRGRTLSLDEQTHVGEVAESLNFTIAQMARIDAAYVAAFPEQAGG